MKPAIVILSVILIWLFGAFSVFAQGKSGGLRVAPAVVEVDLKDPQTEVQIPISFTNNGDSFLSLQIFPIDFKQKNEYGAISFVGQEAGSYSYSLSSFLSFESDSIELAPGEKKEFVVTVRNRQDLSPGGHYAAVVARLLPPGERTDATGIAPAASSLILVRKIGGERFNLSLKDVAWPETLFAFSYPKSITLLFQNEGNIHLVPYGRVEIKDMLGRMLFEGSINNSSNRVFPTSRRYITADLTKMNVSFPVSFNTVSVRGQDSLKETSYIFQETFIYLNPVFVVLLVAGVALLVYLRRRRRAKGNFDGNAPLKLTKSKFKSQKSHIQVKSKK